VTHTSLVQFKTPRGDRGVALLEGDNAPRSLNGVASTYQLAQACFQEGQTLIAAARARLGEAVDLAAMELLCPIDHVDPAHLCVAGTGLTHLGSAKGRDEMHRKVDADAALTDSMKMFEMGVKGGRPPAGQAGVQPEWFYKGDGSVLVAPNAEIASPGFALDAGEEPELAGVYIIDPQGAPVRLGFALGNEFSDHVTERGNYLWLAHSKLRQAALGPELMLGELPADIRGVSRILRSDEVIWERDFLTGEQNMSHTFANLEHHHFKYRLFRRPGDLHVHFFGTATLSFSDGITTQPGDVFEISASPFRMPVRNAVRLEAEEPTVAVRVL
jgi:hypothetical protein